MKEKNYKHWVVLMCCCGLAASSIGSVYNTVGVFYLPVSKSLNVLRGSVALSSTLTLLATAFISLYTPKLISKINFKILIAMGMCLAGGSSFLMAFTNNIVLYNILGIVKGIGSGLYQLLLISTIINHWFIKKNGLAISIALSFSGVAGVVLSPILTNLIINIGWQKTYIVLGFITIFLALPALIYPFHLNPRDEGLQAYGYEDIEIKQIEKRIDTKVKIYDIKFIMMLFLALFIPFITGFTSHLPSYASAIKVGATVGALMLSGGMVGNIVSKLLIGILADYIGIIKATVVMALVNIISLFMLLIFRNDIILVGASVLFGSIYGIAAVGLSLMTKIIFGPDNYIKVFSYISFVQNIGSAFSLTVIGYIYDIFGSYSLAIFILIGLQVTGVLLIYLINKRQTKKTG